MRGGFGTAAFLAVLVAATVGASPVVGTTELPAGKPAQLAAG